jgi:hypothetical protein
MADEPPYDVEFYDEPSGAYPVYDWITNELSPTLRRTIGVAMGEILQYMGVEVCETEWGKPLGGGLYEFRVRHDYDEIMGRRRPLYKRVYPKEKVLLRCSSTPTERRSCFSLAATTRVGSPVGGGSSSRSKSRGGDCGSGRAGRPRSAYCCAG